MKIAAYDCFPEYLTMVEVDTGEGEPWAFLAFDDQRAEMHAIDDVLVLAKGDAGGYAVFDCVARRRLVHVGTRSSHSDIWAFCRKRNTLFVPDGDGSLDENGWLSVNGVREAPLDGGESRFHLISENYRVFWIGVRDDGRVVCNCADEIAILNPETGEVSTSRPEGFEFSIGHILLTRLKWFSPNARWALRVHVGSVIRQKPIRFPWWRRLLGPSPALEHPDLQADGARRYGMALDLFSLDPVAHDRRLIVDYRVIAAPGSQGKRPHPVMAGIDALADQLDHRDWNGRDQLLLSDWPTGMDALARQERNALDDAVAQQLLKPMRHVRWDEDSRGFTVVINNQERHVTLDGEVGPTVPSDWTDEHQLPALPSNRAFKALRREIRTRTVQLVDLPDFSPAGLRLAVQAMADRIEAGLDAIVFRGVLQFRFKAGGKTIGEIGLFRAIRRLSDEDVSPLLPDLRRLIAVFGEQAKGHVDHTGCGLNSGGEPETLRVALADAALALAERDPASFEVLRGWFEQVDQEHDPFAVEAVFPAIARKTGFLAPGAVRFGLWFFLHQWQTTPYEFADFPILSRAREIWTPEAFAGVFLEEARRVVEDKGPGDVRQDFYNCYGAFEDMLELDNEWDSQVLAEVDRVAGEEDD